MLRHEIKVGLSMNATIKHEVIVLPRKHPALYIHSALTGRVIASRFHGYGANERDWQIEAIAEYENCNAADLVFHESDELGPDRYTLNGKVVATAEIG